MTKSGKLKITNDVRTDEQEVAGGDMNMLFTGTIRLVIIAGFLHIVFPRAAHAYLDPGTASYTLQMLIAVLLSAAVVIKTYWAKLKSFVTGLASRRPSAEDQSGDTSAEEQTP